MKNKFLMKAAIINSYGEAGEVFRIDPNAPIPKLDKSSEILVKLAYAGINPIDYKIRSGSLESLIKLKFPAILGIDFSGTVVISAKKDDSSIFKEGVQVYGKLSGPGSHGTYAEYVKVDIEKDAIAVLPANQISLKEAGGCGVAALTSITAFKDYFKLPKVVNKESPPVILVVGASGGVGTFAIQIAKSLGIRTIAVCSGRNESLVKSLGAWHVIDYQKAPLQDTLETFLVENQIKLYGILDLVGGDEYYLNLQKYIQSGGSFVTATGPKPPNGKATLWNLFGFIFKMIKRNLGAMIFRSNASYSFITGLPVKYLRDIDNLYRQGELKTIIHAEFDLENVAKAHKESERGRSVGKIVLKMPQ